MNTLLLFGLCLLSIASGQEDFDALVQDRASPWWQALSDETFYKRCRSSCTEGSQGVTTRVELCDDSDTCRGQKISFDEYATDRCIDWIEDGVIPEVTIEPEGRRFKFVPSKGNWIPCAVFCHTEKGYWYSPRGELGRSAFFPDGTWCHKDSDGQDFFCQKNLCLPRDYQFADALRIAHEATDLGEGSIIVEDEELRVRL